MTRSHPTRRAQPDLFAPAEPDLFEPAPALVHTADPDRVRARLQAILAQAGAADALPWSRAQLRLYRTIVPQMTLWLPEAEAAQWRLDIEAELLRHEAASA